jgi:hypothetical protein
MEEPIIMCADEQCPSIKDCKRSTRSGMSLGAHQIWSAFKRDDDLSKCECFLDKKEK